MVKSIAFVVYSLRGGGAERVISRLANFLSRNLQVHIILLSNDAEFYKIDDRVKMHKPKFTKPNGIKIIYYCRMARYIRATVRENQLDKVISFGESINSFVLLCLYGMPIKKIVSNRASPLSNLNGFRGTVNPIVYPLADSVIVQTSYGVELLRERYRRTKFKVIPNPIVIPENTVPLSDREKIIINVGYVGGKKNQQELIEIFNEVRNKSDWRLWFVGDGPQLPPLRKRVAELNLSDRIIFLGARSDVAELLERAQIFAFTSQTEGFPNALAEALSHGCACISYDIIAGPSDLIKDGVNGRLIMKNDRAGYVRALEQLLSDTELRTEFSTNAQQTVKTFSIEKVADQYLSI